ncbi:sigma factor [Nonomuraea thailandensis]
MERDYVRQRRAETRLEEGRGPTAAFIEATHQPGTGAEVDFGDVWIRLGGQLSRCYLIFAAERAAHASRWCAVRKFRPDQGSALLRYGYVLTGNAEDAADLVQEALLKVSDAWSRVRNKDSPEAYVRMTMARQHIRWWRRRRKEHTTDEVPEGSHPRHPHLRRALEGASHAVQEAAGRAGPAALRGLAG